jgi:hypothetical protein
MLTIVDNSGNVITPLTFQSVNNHDSCLFFESFEKLLEMTDFLEVELKGTYLTLDSAFDNVGTRSEILLHKMKPVIKPNLRGLKNQRKINRILNEFSKVEHIYKQRHIVEKYFAWEDSYRKLAVRYEKLQCTFNGFRLLAFSMINFRNVFN